VTQLASTFAANAGFDQNALAVADPFIQIDPAFLADPGTIR